MSNKFQPESQALVSYSLMGPESGGPCLVDSNQNRITRIRPYAYDKAYTDVHCNPWKIEARGQTFTPPDRVTITPLGLGYKSRVYSPNRVKYPLKRVDWDPKGERNPQNRGKSKYVRISWDEAAQICADELKRMKETYGPEAVLCESDMHGEGKRVAPSHGCPNRLLALMGGYTLQMRNMDSWEGWYWGAKHVWGCEPVGEMAPTANLYPDIAQHSDMLLFWGCDAETTPLGVVSHMPSRLCYWFTDLGIECVYICPDLNYAAAVHADKWIPILPNTDAALQLAIAYIWLTEGTYDKDYIATHTYGFDKFAAYVLGEEDGVPKTPRWASEKCGVKPWTIKAPPLGEKDHLHPPRQRRLLHPRPLRHRARPAGGDAAGDAGAGPARRPPGQDDRVEHVGPGLPGALSGGLRPQGAPDLRLPAGGGRGPARRHRHAPV